MFRSSQDVRTVLNVASAKMAKVVNVFLVLWTHTARQTPAPPRSATKTTSAFVGPTRIAHKAYFVQALRAVCRASRTQTAPAAIDRFVPSTTNVFHANPTTHGNVSPTLAGSVNLEFKPVRTTPPGVLAKAPSLARPANAAKTRSASPIAKTSAKKAARPAPRTMRPYQGNTKPAFVTAKAAWSKIPKPQIAPAVRSAATVNACLTSAHQHPASSTKPAASTTITFKSACVTAKVVLSGEPRQNAPPTKRAATPPTHAPSVNPVIKRHVTQATPTPAAKASAKMGLEPATPTVQPTAHVPGK